MARSPRSLPRAGSTNTAGPKGCSGSRSGVARIALPTNAPVIPVGIWGTQVRYPRGGIRWGRPLRPRLAIAFGPPLLPSGDAATPADVEAFVARVGERLETQVAEAQHLAGAG